MSYTSQYDGQSFGYEEERDGYDMRLEQMQKEEYENEQALMEYEEQCARKEATHE